MTAEAFKVADAASYDGLAGEFDRLTRAYSTYAVDALLERACVGRAARALDIGCGSGVVALAAAALRSREARTIGVDLSGDMLAVARERARLQGVEDRTEFVRGDAEALPFDDASMDAVTSLYAFRHFPNPHAAAREALRVLKPGARCAVAVGSGAPLLSLDGARAALGRAAHAVRRAAGRELLAPGYLEALVERHLPAASREEVAGWTRRRESYSASVASILRAAGFVDVAGIWLGRSYTIGTVEEFWTLQATFSSKARKRIADAPADWVAALETAFREECEAVLRGGRLVYRVGAAIVSGTRPETPARAGAAEERT